jgi:hypothetical protein
MDHTAATCPLFTKAHAAIAAESRDPPAERLAALWAAIPPGTLTAPVAAFLHELFSQVSALRQEMENLRAAMDMEGI